MMPQRALEWECHIPISLSDVCWCIENQPWTIINLSPSFWQDSWKHPGWTHLNTISPSLIIPRSETEILDTDVWTWFAKFPDQQPIHCRKLSTQQPPRPPLFFLPRLLSFASRLNFKKSLDSCTWRHWWFAQPWWQNYHHHPPPTSVGWYIFLDDGCLVSQPRSSDETGISCYNLAWFLKHTKDFKGVGGFLHQPGTVFGLWYLLSVVETQTWVIHATVVCLWQNSNTSQFSSLTYATTFYIILQNRSKAA